MMAKLGKVGSKLVSAIKDRASAAAHAVLRACRSSLSAFLGSRKGAAVLVACAGSVGVLAVTGSMMTNYAWRESQWEEIRTALRAAVSSAGPLLAGIGNPTVEEQIRERISQFAQGSMPGFELDPTDVALAHDTGTGVTTISVAGEFAFQDLWGTDPNNQAGGSVDGVDASIAVKFETERYEVGIALDISGSMRISTTAADGSRVSRMNALKTAMATVADVMQATNDDSPGTMLVSVIPFTTAVNVADTGTNGPVADQGRTAAKERYVRMLAGAPGAGETITDTLRAAQTAATNGTGQWVDTFHHYGVGNDLGPLRAQGLPQDLLDNTDWNLRRTNVAVDVSSQVPALGTWTVDDEDFWNGCVMARWGAYWNTGARPTGWVSDSSTNWPATKSVAGWSTGSAALPASTPLHLSDAPPAADDPHTLFTAYSWPDSRIGGQADQRLQAIMAALLDTTTHALRLTPRGGSFFNIQLPDDPFHADNDWAATGSRGGATLCPEHSISPLTDDATSLRQTVAALDIASAFTPDSSSLVEGTYLNLGIVWGLRTLSPLWQRVWQVSDLQGNARPEVPCAPGETGNGCNPLLHKSILIISDGTSYPGELLRSRLGELWRLTPRLASPPHQWDELPRWSDSRACSPAATAYLGPYHQAGQEGAEADFNNRFSPYLSDGEHFGDIMSPGAYWVQNQFRILDRWTGNPSARRILRATALTSMSPWELFRGLDADTVDALMDEANEFGFDRRPVQAEHLCRPSSMFSSYGRIDDRVLVGTTDAVPPAPVEPVADVAPFNLAGLPTATAGDGRPGSGDFRRGGLLADEMADRLDGWFLESCRIANRRRVRINAIFVGTAGSTSSDLAVLERCVDAAGGTANHQDVYLVTDGEALNDAFTELFTARRNLRFLD